VALEALHPFSRSQFSDLVTPFVAWATDYVGTAEIDGRIGWLPHFHSYSWAGADWRGGLESRRQMTRGLESARNEDQLLEAIDEIAEWGGMPELSWEDAEEIAASLPVLDKICDGGADWTELHAGRIATTSKVYEMHDPAAWTIYDSRVASALVKLVDIWWSEVGEQHARLLRFSVPLPRGGKRKDLPAGFPGSSTDQQARLNFIYASWLLRDIAECLATREAGPDGSDWQLVHVEMVLFMLGGSSVDWGQ